MRGWQSARLTRRCSATDGCRCRSCAQLALALGRRAGFLAAQAVRSVSLVGSLARGEGGPAATLVELATFVRVDLVTLREEPAAEFGRKLR